ncbi:hypothetical protein K461DRAFT_139820 [Myriangium duriaei CBS 260.36]|uniref:Uncharacterized protein n=1 Tax=Myriangium duriaei CBS 260.36 TaxID=1168546 RepID=A0A9P4J6N9_9PEZI|nr:hypothetical protein K461DRAFT_139820 [Myriangium duriaei CBS 260.36]
MPSSSTGLTHGELLIRHHLALISAHLHYYIHTSASQIPYVFSPTLPSYDRHIPHHLSALFTHLLDHPVSIPHVDTDTTRPYGAAFVSTLTDLMKLRPHPAEILERLSMWLDALAARLEALGRLQEAGYVAEAGDRVWSWKEEVKEAFEEMEMDEARVREGVRGVCLRWGV